MIFRSEAVLIPTADDAAKLSKMGIALVCDLRGASERSHMPNVWWTEQKVELLETDILADIRGSPEAWEALRKSQGAEGAKAVMRSIYHDLPQAAANALAVIFSRVADGCIPLLIHCTAGKDRTGFISAMILTVLGVSYDDVLTDYLASNSRMNEAVAGATRRLIMERAGKALPEEAMAAINGVEEAYLQESFKAIEINFGSIKAYIRTAAGLDAEKEKAVRKQLLT